MTTELNKARKTVVSRLEIGFEDLRKNWHRAPMEYNEEGSLKILGHPVMERWEEDYMEDLASVACQNGGTILEVGFGLGISASKIQTHNIENHVVIEANYAVFRTLLDFAKNARSQVIAINGFWEECVNYLAPNTFDGILFDTYPLTELEIHKNHYNFFPYAYNLLKKGGVLTYYSDEKTSYSDEHLNKLKAAGFTNIDARICKLDTPAKCQYWDCKTMITPIIRK